MNEKLSYTLKQLEASMRGKKLSDNFLSDTKELFNWSRSCFVEEKKLDEKEKVLLIESAVKMHNRAKTITNAHLSESVTYLKATAAWLLSTYAEKNTKFSILFIRLHCRIASEWIQLNAIDNATDSFKEALGTWKTLNISALERLLPDVELRTLLKTVFYGYLDYSKILRGRDNCDLSEIKLCIGGALEMLSQSRTQRLALARHVLELAHSLASLTNIEEGMHYFKLIHSILDSPLFLRSDKPAENNLEEIMEETWERETLLIKIKSFLGLGYLYKELNQCVKAKGCIKEAKSNNDELFKSTSESKSPARIADETFTFATFSINCRENDVPAAYASL